MRPLAHLSGLYRRFVVFLHHHYSEIDRIPVVLWITSEQILLKRTYNAKSLEVEDLTVKARVSNVVFFTLPVVEKMAARCLWKQKETGLCFWLTFPILFRAKKLISSSIITVTYFFSKLKAKFFIIFNVILCIHTEVPAHANTKTWWQ